jgi:PE-PPE domain
LTINIFSACGTGENSSQDATTQRNLLLTVDNQWGGFSWQVAKGVSQTLFTPTQIVYPAKGFWLGNPIDYDNSVQLGVEAGANLITNCSGSFVLVGYSQGAEVISRLLQQLQPGGPLTAHMPKLLAAVTFGNPMRQQGHTFPGDPTGCTGQGINSQALLIDTPELWWDMTNIFDLAGNIPTAAPGAIINQIWQAGGTLDMTSVAQMMEYIAQTLAQDTTNPADRGPALFEAVTFLADAITNVNTTGHACFDTATVGDTGLTFVQTAINYLNSRA